PRGPGARHPRGTTEKKARGPTRAPRIDLRGVLAAPAPLPTVQQEAGGPPPPLAETGRASPPLAKAPAEPPLSLDDDPEPVAPSVPAGPPPLRVRVRVTDSTRQFTGPCQAVLVPHGLFLESVPYRPFLYIPVRSRVSTRWRGGLAVTLADGRAGAPGFTGPPAGPPGRGPAPV